MITKPTALILGAGASVDYGFPTGRNLLLEIWKNAREGCELFKFLTKSLEMPREQIEKFADALIKSAAPSVDLFLEHRTDFEEIGKIAIAATLIPHENYDAFKLPDKPSWYHTLFQLMVEGGNFEENRLSVITFNYDRSLEAFLFQSLKNLYGLDDKTAEEQLGKIQIIHLYGSLGDMLTGDGHQRGYEPTLRGDWTQQAAKKIKIVHEAQPGAEFETAQNLLRGDAEIIFLGFGFHPVNVQRLRLQEAAEWHQSVHGSSIRWLACRYGMGDGERARAESCLQEIEVEFATDPKWDIDKYLKNTNCLNPQSIKSISQVGRESSVLRVVTDDPNDD